MGLGRQYGGLEARNTSPTVNLMARVGPLASTHCVRCKHPCHGPSRFRCNQLPWRENCPIITCRPTKSFYDSSTHTNLSNHFMAAITTYQIILGQLSPHKPIKLFHASHCNLSFYNSPPTQTYQTILWQLSPHKPIKLFNDSHCNLSNHFMTA